MTRIFFVLVVVCAASCVRRPASPEDVKQTVIDRTMSLRTYRATMETEMFSGAVSRMIGAPDAGPGDVALMKASTTMETWLPDRMRSSVTVNGPGGGGPVRFESVYDGANVWVSSVSGADEQHHRVDQKLAMAGHPFDVGFNMRGGGLVEGEDFRGSVLWFLDTWTLTSATPSKRGDAPCTELKGTMNVERGLDIALGTKGEKIAPHFAPENREAFDIFREALAGTMGRALAEMRVGTMCVSSDGDVVAWSFGDETSLLQTVTVTSFERNPTIPIERFSVPAATQAIAVDVSDTVRKSRAAPPVAPNELAAFRSAVLAASARVMK